jgi:ZIP family zinc transporter
MRDIMNETLMALLVVALGTWFAAALGAAIIAIFRKDNIKMSRIIMGFAAGVILAITFWELLYPAMHMAEYGAIPAWLVVPGAFGLGVLFVFFLDRVIHKIGLRKRQEGKECFKYRKSLVLTSALSLHNIPEGFALGVALGALGAGFEMEALFALVPMAIGIGLHKMPEGSVIAVSFRREGLGKLASFFAGQISGFLGFIMGIAGFFIAASIDALMPFALAFAGGAMVWVAIFELIPAGHNEGLDNSVNNGQSSCGCPKKSKNVRLTTLGVILGILAMILLHTLLPHAHHHDHGHGHYHHHHDHGHHDHHHDHHDHHHDHHDHHHDHHHDCDHDHD